MRSLRGIVVGAAAALTAASLLGCVGSTMTGGPVGRPFCNVSSTDCMLQKAQQSKTGTISGQHARCCS